MESVKSHKFQNTVLGWIIFIIASGVYLSTIEPTASWWDCGEYITTAYKLEVGHPPGAPTFQLMGRFFSLFAFGNTEVVAKMVNAMSAIFTGLAAMFAFWTITFFARKFYVKKSEDMTTGQSIAVLGAGSVGALTFTFLDSVWFSAVEGEVYATSMMFTAAVVWLMTKWEQHADSRDHLKYILLIAFLMGLSIGVHLLNLLTIPAMAYLYYYKKFKPSTKGFILTGIIGLLILVMIQNVIIPGVVKLASAFELFFVNSIGLPFNSGVIVYFAFILAILVLGLFLTRRKTKVILNTVFLGLTFILIGYSTFFVIVIRANANTPLNENEPKDAISLLSYLNRDQYGSWPVFHGQYYNAPVRDVKEGGNVYIKGSENGKDKYVAVSKKISYEYDDNYCTFFPRMYSDQAKHVRAYKEWAGIKGDRKPTFGENLSFFFRNQIGNQYLRYFMWNFAGRQNDVQGFGLDGNGNWDIQNGNWISGIGFIDKARLGNQSELPERMENNKARNTFYLLPLLLGLLGMVYHFIRKPKDALVILMLFLLTGVAIIVYLNVVPYQPRERDYAYAGSFYAFALWVGLGILPLFDLLKKFIPHVISAAGTAIIGILLVPTIMGAQGWADHDRSGKYACRDFARNYLNSCAPNAILITNGDNDTFPLWYAQEVEGVRTDVRVVNFTLASGDWYIHQLYNKLYDSDPLPLTIPADKYTTGTNDFVPYYDQVAKGGIWDLRKVIEMINSDSEGTKVRLESGKQVGYLPSKDLMLTVDSLKVLQNGTVPQELADKIVESITWKVKKGTLYKNDLMLLDLIATNNWERPIYFASPSSVDDFITVSDYCFLEGFVYRFIPVKTDGKRGGGVFSDRSYDLIMNEFQYGNLANPDVYCDKESYGMSMVTRNNFARVAQSLILEEKKTEAKKVLNKGIEMFPDVQVPYDKYMIYYVDLYYQLEEFDKGTEILLRIAEVTEQTLNFIFSLDNKRQLALKDDLEEAVQILQYLYDIAQKSKQEDAAKKIDEKLKRINP